MLQPNPVHSFRHRVHKTITYAVATIALSFVGTKGIDKIGKLEDVEKLLGTADKAEEVETITKTTLAKPAFAEKKDSLWDPLSPEFQFDGGNVPYNKCYCSLILANS